MAESYGAGLKGVLSSLQSSCRGSNSEQVKKCKRAMEERMIISEVALSQDKPIQQWKATELGKVKDCYDRCHVEGRTQIRECNSACLGGLIQALWTRVNIEEFDQIAMKYA